MSRIVTPQGFIPGDEGKPDRPPKMEERIQEALAYWQAGNKDRAFAQTLNCIAYLSNGLAGLGKLTAAMRIENEALEKRIAELEKPKP